MFMDLLFKRYASPFLLLDNYIQQGRFFEFIVEFAKITNEEKMFDVWKHKVFDKSFEEFKETIMTETKNETINVSKIAMKKTIQDSRAILESFDPQQGGE